MRRLAASLMRARLATAAASSRGFSLLEVLVAFVILSLVATALFRLFSGALNNGSAADDYSRAALIAESELATLAVEKPLREDQEQGVSADGRYAWEAKIEHYVPPNTSSDLERLGEFLPTRLWRLAVIVTWPADSPNKRSYSLATVRLGAKE